MYIDFTTVSASDAYFAMTQTIVPRPIAWILSENADKSLNLAPFSFFNAFCSEPPLIGVSIGKKPDGSLKDTRINIIQRKHFVVHIAHAELLAMLNASAQILPANVSEVELLGLHTTPFENFSLPRLDACRVALACELYDEITMGESSYVVLLGQIKALYAADSVAHINEKQRFTVDANALQPVGRLGANEYVSFGEKIILNRPD